MTIKEIMVTIRNEIERLYNDKSYSEDRWDLGYDCACEDIMSFLIDLEKSEKSASVSIEEKAKAYCPDDAYPFGPDIINKEVRKAFIAGYNLHKEETEEKTSDAEWQYENDHADDWRKPVEMGQL